MIEKLCRDFWTREQADDAIGNTGVESENRQVSNVGSYRHQKRPSRKFNAYSVSKLIKRLCMRDYVFVRSRNISGLNEWIFPVVKHGVCSWPMCKLSTFDSRGVFCGDNFPMLWSLAEPGEAGVFERGAGVEAAGDGLLDERRPLLPQHLHLPPPQAHEPVDLPRRLVQIVRDALLLAGWRKCNPRASQQIILN